MLIYLFVVCRPSSVYRFGLCRPWRFIWSSCVNTRSLQVRRFFCVISAWYISVVLFRALIIVKKLCSLQRLLRTTSAISQIYDSKYHKRWYYFAAQWHFGDVLQLKLAL